jgi:PHD/YefM family antitoxin component YafN of YafNO toxin-antitoxin module
MKTPIDTDARVTVSSSQFQKQFGYYQTIAVRAPVAIERNGRPHSVLLSADEFQRLVRNDRRVYRRDEMPEELRDMIRGSANANVHDDLNGEMES